MHRHIKLAFTTLIACAALAALVGTASARNLSTSSQSIRVAFSSVEFVAEGAGTLRCAVTLEGSFHSRTIAKITGSLVGYVTRGIVRRPCTGGTVWAYNGTETNEVLGGTFATSLPWHITYEGFGGTLPNITSLRILLSRARYRARVTTFLGTLLCDYTTGAANGGNATGTATRNTTTGVVDNLRVSGSISSESGGFCIEGNFENPANDGIVTQLAATAKITITLI